MASVRSSLIVHLMRLWTRVVFNRGYTIERNRVMLQAQDDRSRGKGAEGIEVVERPGSLPGRWLRNSRMRTRRVFLYLHGGAFIMRMPESHTVMVSRLCKRSGFEAYMPWYRLAPEHPFPAALDDCFEAYQYLLTEYSADQIVIAGDSAGGNLTLSLLNLIKQKSCPMPAGALALSPITDFQQLSATWLTNYWRDPLFPMQQHVAPQRHYLQGGHLDDPLASPVYGNLEGLPPVLIVAGGIEALLDDAVAYVRKAQSDGVDARVHIWQGMPHVHTLMPGIPETDPTEDQILDWLEGLYSGQAQTGASWEQAVTFFNRTPLIGRVTRASNGERVRSYVSGVADK